MYPLFHDRDNKHLRWLQSLENTDLFVEVNTRLLVLTTGYVETKS